MTIINLLTLDCLLSEFKAELFRLEYIDMSGWLPALNAGLRKAAVVVSLQIISLRIVLPGILS